MTPEERAGKVVLDNLGAAGPLSELFKAGLRTAIAWEIRDAVDEETARVALPRKRSFMEELLGLPEWRYVSVDTDQRRVDLVKAIERLVREKCIEELCSSEAIPALYKVDILEVIRGNMPGRNS